MIEEGYIPKANEVELNSEANDALSRLERKVGNQTQMIDILTLKVSRVIKLLDYILEELEK